MDYWITGVANNYNILKKQLKRLSGQGYEEVLYNLYESEDDNEKILLNQIIDVFYVSKIYSLLMSVWDNKSIEKQVIDELEYHLNLSLEEFKEEIFNEVDIDNDIYDDLSDEENMCEIEETIEFQEHMDSFIEYTSLASDDLKEFDVDFEEYGVSNKLLLKSPFYFTEYMNRVLTEKENSSIKLYKQILDNSAKEEQDIDYYINHFMIEIDNINHCYPIAYKAVVSDILAAYEAITHNKVIENVLTKDILKEVLTNKKNNSKRKKLEMSDVNE